MKEQLLDSCLQVKRFSLRLVDPDSGCRCQKHTTKCNQMQPNIEMQPYCDW